MLSNVLVESVDDGMWISGTDLDVAIRTKVPADVARKGSITAPGRKLQQLVRELPDEPVALRVRGDQLDIRCGRGRFKLNGLPSEEFPNLPEVNFQEGWSIARETLGRLIKSTSFAVSTEESRPLLNGVLWELRDGSMSMVATNGHRLAKRGAETDPTPTGSANLIVPPVALAQVHRLFEEDSRLAVAKNGNYLGFRSEDTEVYTRLIEGSYPNYEQVIPKDNDKTATVDKGVFEAAVRRMAVVASEEPHRTKLSFESDRVRLNVTTPDLGEAYDEVELDYLGEAMEIAFNARYLLEVMKCMPGGDITFSFKTSERAATVKPADDQLDYLCLVMPLRLVD